MATLIEQVEASMKLCAALERRVAALEKVVGRDGRTETVERSSSPRKYRRRKAKRVSNKEGVEIRATILRELSGGERHLKYLRRVTRTSVFAMRAYINDLVDKNKIEHVGRPKSGLYRAKNLKALAA